MRYNCKYRLEVQMQSLLVKKGGYDKNGQVDIFSYINNNIGL